jgi:membrane-bound metal-dependent hydrolase YbcI (DUF457 family)
MMRIFLPKNGKYLHNVMYFFFHLLTGIVLGFLISDLLYDRRWIIPCAAGAILPDLIDKPVGYILFPATIGYGRIYSHTLLAALLVLAVGMVIWRVAKEPGVIGLSVGILSHQVLDLMWRQPVNWYYPLLGPFKGETTEDYFFVMLVKELNNPFEWIVAFIVGIGLLAIIFRTRIPPALFRHRHVVSVIAAGSALMLCVVSGIVMGWGWAKKTIPDIGWSRPEELMLGGIVMALSAYLVWRWQSAISKG